MSEYDELDEEIDREMGWHRGGKKRVPRRSAGPSYWEALRQMARGAARPLWRLGMKILRGLAKVAFFPVISPLGYTKHFDVHGDMMIVKRPLAWRLCDGVLTRALLTPVILAVFMIGMVYASTHPRTVRAVATPDSLGLYFKRVGLLTVDNQQLTAWYIPPINAEQIAADPEGTLLQKWPGVVLCHGLGASHDQYLPLAGRMHGLGFAVLMLDMRGQG
jgi:hypothetical protein